MQPAQGGRRESGIVRAMGELAKCCGVKIRCRLLFWRKTAKAGVMGVQAAFATGSGPSAGMAAQRHVHRSDTTAAIYSGLKLQ